MIVREILEKSIALIEDTGKRSIVIMFHDFEEKELTELMVEVKSDKVSLCRQDGGQPLVFKWQMGNSSINLFGKY